MCLKLSILKARGLKSRIQALAVAPLPVASVVASAGTTLTRLTAERAVIHIQPLSSG